MVAIRIINELNDLVCGVHLYEDNYNDEVEVQDDFHCHAVEEGYDSIFGTCDNQVVVIIREEDILDPVVDSIVSHLCNEHEGETYELNDARRCALDQLDHIVELIARNVDKKMMKDHLEDDNLTIKGDE